MSKDGQDDKNVNTYQVQLNDNNSSNNQEQKENASTNNDAKTPEAVTSPSNANISGEQNTSQINSESDKVLGEEGTANDPVGVEQNEINNKKEQSSLGTNIGDTQDKTESVNANNASIEPENKNVDKDLEQLLSRIDKGEPPQKLEDAQVKNVLGDIKAQMASATNNYAELSRLAGALAALAASTNNPELLATIKSMLNAVEGREETAKEVIRNDATSDNLEAQEPIEQTEHKANIEKYTAIKADFHKKLDEDLELLDAAIDPSRATPEQRRILENDLTDAEREELKRKNQLKKEGYEHVYNIKEHAEREIKQNNTKITKIDERLKATKDDNQRQSLEAEKQKYIQANEVRQQELDDYVKEALAKRNTEREKLAEFTKLKERVEKYPNFSKETVREHFELHAAEYDKNPDRTAINELHAMVRKVKLAEELGVSPEPQEGDQIQSVQKINARQEVVKQNLNKAINQVHEQYSGHIPREATDKIANIIEHNLGYAEHATIIAEKKQVKEITQEKTNAISPPPKTPTVDKNGPGRGVPWGGTGGRGV